MGAFPTESQPIGGKKTLSVYCPACLHIFEASAGYCTSCLHIFEAFPGYFLEAQRFYLNLTKTADATEKFKKCQLFFSIFCSNNYPSFGLT